MPMPQNLAHDARHARKRLFWLVPGDKIDESHGLGFQSFAQVRILQFSLAIQQVIYLGQKDPFRVQESVAVAEDQLQLFDGPQRAPDSGGAPYKADRSPLETFRELEHVDEILQHAWHAAVVFRGDDDQPSGLENGLGKRSEDFWFLRIRTGMKYFRWE